jgi:FlaA1/EpsC-like NDP-sugar epimerase
MRIPSKRKRLYLRLRPWLWLRTATIFHDVIAVLMAWLGAFWLRFNFNIPADYWNTALKFLPFVLVMQQAVLFVFRLDRITARFASLPDLLHIIEAALLANSLTALVLFAWNRLSGVPRSVFVLDFLLLVFLLGGIRLAFRLYKDGFMFKKDGLTSLIVGAGQAGEQLVRDLLRKGHQAYQPVGFLDDDRLKIGKEISGIRVLGRTRELPRLVRQLDIEMVMFAMPSASRRIIKRLTELCRDANVPYRTLPSTHDLISGQITVSTLREVTIDDLLGREPVKLDWRAIQAQIAHQVVLIGGAGGSIGSELCRQIARLSPSMVILLEISEFNLYQIEMELREQYPKLCLQAVLGDICDHETMKRVFALMRPAIVFHSAAYKHVPLVELNPDTGVQTNVAGTRILADTAARYGTNKFIMISTDKAVNPTSIMGASKRIAEIYCQNFDSRSETAFITTRFGNVLGSSGSVVPLFKRQIESGGPVTVTHPEIERYFMTIPEACQLVLQAATIGQGGEIFVLDMGEPVKIQELAKQIIRLSGLIPEKDIPIIYTGLRPGEKLFEELFHPDEQLRTTTHPKIMLARSRHLDWIWLQAQMKRLERACTAGDSREIRRCLRSIVPEYSFPDTQVRAEIRPLQHARCEKSK